MLFKDPLITIIHFVLIINIDYLILRRFLQSFFINVVKVHSL